VKNIQFILISDSLFVMTKDKIAFEK